METIIGCALISLSIIQFVFSGFYFYIAKQKLGKLEETDLNEIKPVVKINANLLLEGYNIKKFIQAVNLYIDNTNKTNKNVNIATAVVTLIAGIATSFSSVVLIFK